MDEDMLYYEAMGFIEGQYPVVGNIQNGFWNLPGVKLIEDRGPIGVYQKKLS